MIRIGSSKGPAWLRWMVALALAVSAVMAGCGGGVGVGGTGAFASGPITGFGSVFVGGIEFDDASASVLDEDGAASSRAALRLGMVAEVDSGPVGGSEAAPVATATTIRYAAELVGLAGAIDVPNATLTVFGQTVKVSELTVFDPALANGLASVADGSALEVYGFHDPATGQYGATRIQPRNGTLSVYRVRGPVADLDRTARRFRIGSVPFSYTGEAPVLAEGAIVRLQADTTPVAGRWVVRSVVDGVRRLPDLDHARLHGPISRYGSDTDFSVDGQTVDARTASFIGRPGDLALGVNVVVDGRVQSGVLVASRVRIDERGGSQGAFQLKGAIQSVDAPAQTLRLRDLTVDYGSNGVQFVGGSAADLLPGRTLDVRGVLSASGTRLSARRITFD